MADIDLCIHQVVLNNGDNEGLFRGAVAFSGGPMKVDNMDRQQPIFDSMVTSTGCTNSNDVLKCLRKAKFEDIYAAVQEQRMLLLLSL